MPWRKRAFDVGGILYGIGVGPGDPELMTFKAARLLSQASTIAYFAKAGNASHARAIAAAHIKPDAHELPLLYPVTTEHHRHGEPYKTAMRDFYETSAAQLAAILGAGQDVAVISEGDPLFYGSYMHLHVRLAPRFKTCIVPAVTGMAGCWGMAQVPITQGDDVFSVIPATLDEAQLETRLHQCDAAVIMKLGRNLPKVRRALHNTGTLGRAVYCERGTMEGGYTIPLAQKADDTAPYFSMVLVPGWSQP